MRNKRTRVGSWLLVLAMLLTMLPATASAAGGEAAESTGNGTINSYDTLTAAIEAAEPGTEIRIDDNFAVSDPITITKEITLNLNGKTISSNSLWDEQATPADISIIEVGQGGNLTVTGEGTLKAAENDCYAIDVYDGGVCTIQDGTFVGNISAIYVTNGTVTINGGTFSIQQLDNNKKYAFLLNCLDVSYRDGIAKIIVNGGTFENFNPRACAAETNDNTTNFCAPGCTVSSKQENDKTVYTVTKVKDGNMVVIPEAITENTVTVSLEGTFSTNGTVEGNGTEGAPSGEVEGTSVQVDLGTSEGNTTAASLNVAAETMQSLASGGAALSIESDVGSVSFDNAALDRMADAASETPVVITVTANKTVDTVTSWTLTATADERNVFGPDSSSGAVTVTVNGYTAPEDAEQHYVYCVDTNEKVAATYNAESSTLSWTTSHFSDWLPMSDLTEATWTTAGDPSTSDTGTFDEALEAVKTDGGAITLLTDVNKDASSEGSGSDYDDYAMIIVPEGKTLTIQSPEGERHTLTLNYTADQANSITKQAGAFHISDTATLNLENVTVNINGSEVSQAGGQTPEKAKVGSGFRLYDSSKLNLTNATVNLKGLSRGVNAGAGTGNAVTLDGGSKLDIRNLSGFASNGSSWTVKGGSNVTVDACGNHGLGVEKLEITGNSSVDVSNTQGPGIIVTGTNSTVEIEDSSHVTVTDCATAEGEKRAAVELSPGSSGNGTLTVDASSSLTASGTDGNSRKIHLQTDAEVPANVSGDVYVGEADAPAATRYAVTFSVTPDSANVVVKKDGREVSGAGFVFSLEAGTYTYEVSASGYRTKTDTVTVENIDQTIQVALNRISGSSGSSTSAAITVTDSAHGDISVSPTRASAGRTVTITVDPDAGYGLDALTVTDSKGNEIELTRVSDTKYTFTMPNGRVTVEASFRAVSTLPFTDVDVDDWFYESVEYVYDNDLMNGVSSTRFAPDGTLTRAMVVTVLYRMEGEPAVTGAAAFTDVAADQWYSEAVAWAAANGIVNGVSDTEFAPERSITREQLAAMLYRYAAYKGEDTTASGSLSGYTDASSVSTYAADALTWCVQEGLVNGVGANTLLPGGTATRAQASAMLMRLLENVMA